MNASKSPPSQPAFFAGKCVSLVGRFASGSQAEVANILSQLGARVVPHSYPNVQYIIVGEGEPPGKQSFVPKENRKPGFLASSTAGRPFVLSESQMWAWVGLLRLREDAVSLFTLAAAAELAGLKRWLLRRWIHLGLLRPKCWVFRAPYLDYQEVALARRLAGWLRTGLSWRELELSLWRIGLQIQKRRKYLEGHHITCVGKYLLLHGPDGPVDPQGQRWLIPLDNLFPEGSSDISEGNVPWKTRPRLLKGVGSCTDIHYRSGKDSPDEWASPATGVSGWEAEESQSVERDGGFFSQEGENTLGQPAKHVPGESEKLFDTESPASISAHLQVAQGVDPLVVRLADLVGEQPAGTAMERIPFLEHRGSGVAEGELPEDLSEAIAAQRLRLATSGPDPEGCFILAELLYQAGELQAARERYWMAIELDENFVEARTNLACVLAQLGQWELAEAALRGAIDLQPDFPDAHWHLAVLLERSGRKAEALHHWAEYCRLAPESPWAKVAQTKLQDAQNPG
jgi:hypothetical protein